MRRALAAVLAGLLLVAVPTAAHAARTKKPKKPAASFVRVDGGPRTYWVYTPSGRAPHRGRPMVVYLHGCTQADDEEHEAKLAFGTGWNELAEEKNFVVVYPIQAEYDMEQPEAVEGNGGGCWNWFLEQNQHRDQGEAEMIADITRTVAASHHVDRDRMFVAGTSAGADMTVVMGATYPDLYRAIAPYSGCAFKSCTDVTGRLAYEAMAEHARVVPAIIFQGDVDPVNNYALDQTLLNQQLGTADWADDGQPNGSVSRVPERQTHGVESAGDVDPDPDNACVENDNLPCYGGALGWDSYPYTVDRYSFADGSRVVVEHWTIHGLTHTYPGGDPKSTFTDPTGPDITRAAWGFFAAYR